MNRRPEFTQHHDHARRRRKNTPGGWVMVLGGLLALALTAGASRAEEQFSSAGEDIIVRADEATLDREAGTGVYSGNAEMVQGQRRLQADRIELRVENGRVQRAEAHGDPVRIREGEELSGHARRVVYKVADDEVHLYDNAFISHKGRTFEGAKLHYELQSRRVRASGSDSERVRMVIPQQDSPDGNKDQR